MNEALKLPPEAPSPAALAMKLAAAILGGTVIVGRGQFSPWPDHARIGVLRVDGAPTLISDGFFPEAELPALREALAAHAQVWPGELDMMYATPWKWAWTTPPAPFRLYGRQGLACALDEGLVRANGRSFEVTSIIHVLGWAADAGVERGVDLVLRAGERVTVALEKEWAAALDPTYDGIDLLCDAAWVPSLGRSLAQGLGVPYTASERALA